MTQSGMREDTSERTIGELFARLASDTGTLVRQEVRLAVAETRQNVRSVGTASVWLVAGGALAVASSLVLIAALVLLLSAWIPAWIAATLVGLIVGVSGMLIASRGWSELKQVEVAPDEAIESIKEDAEWLKQQIKN